MTALAMLLLAAGLMGMAGPAGADTLKESESRDSSTPDPVPVDVRLETNDPDDPEALKCYIENAPASCSLVLWLCTQPGWVCEYSSSAQIDPDLLDGLRRQFEVENDTSMYDPFNDCWLMGLPIACDLAKDVCGEMYGTITCGPIAPIAGVDTPDPPRRVG